VEGALDGSAQLDADPRSAELELRPFEVRTFRITLDDGNAR
jgi:hypothetical protein